jgi:hypothetical protein
LAELRDSRDPNSGHKDAKIGAYVAIFGSELKLVLVDASRTPSSFQTAFISKKPLKALYTKNWYLIFWVMALSEICIHSHSCMMRDRRMIEMNGVIRGKSGQCHWTHAHCPFLNAFLSYRVLEREKRLCTPFQSIFQEPNEHKVHSHSCMFSIEPYQSVSSRNFSLTSTFCNKLCNQPRFVDIKNVA